MYFKLTAGPAKYFSRQCSLHTVPKETDFPRYNMKCSGKKRYYAEYFMQYHVFHYISCYNAEIWITFRTVHGWPIQKKEKHLNYIIKRFIIIYAKICALYPLCTSRLNLYDDIEEFTVKLFSVQFSSGFFSRKALDICFYMQKTEVFYLVQNSFYK